MAKPKKTQKILQSIDGKWVQFITFWTLVLSVSISFLSDALVSGVSTFVATLLLLTIIAIGIVFDIIGIAVTAAEVKGFHAMGANRVPSADYAIALIRNADKVSNFCNDVIGDICGIVSGAVGTMIVFRILGSFGFINGTLLSVLFTGAISATTVGGKAIGKSISISYAQEIVMFSAKIIRRFSFFFPLKEKKNKNKGAKDEKVHAPKNHSRSD
jgi:hypothetical protein